MRISHIGPRRGPGEDVTCLSISATRALAYQSWLGALLGIKARCVIPSAFMTCGIINCLATAIFFCI